MKIRVIIEHGLNQVNVEELSLVAEKEKQYDAWQETQDFLRLNMSLIGKFFYQESERGDAPKWDLN